MLMSRSNASGPVRNGSSSPSCPAPTRSWPRSGGQRWLIELLAGLTACALLFAYAWWAPLVLGGAWLAGHYADLYAIQAAAYR